MKKIELEVWSVEEKLPESYDSVVVFFSGGWVSTGFVNPKGIWIFDDETIESCVVYWAYVPEVV
jgi:hypothetical protein